MIAATEAEIQATIIEGLRLMQYIVLCTTHRVKRCRKCGTFPNAGYGADKGVPDLLVTHRRWPAGLFLGLEIKGAKTALSPEQKELLDLNRIIICRSWEDALAAVKGVENE